MKSRFRWSFAPVLVVSCLVTLPGFAQDPAPSAPPSSGGWRRFQPNVQAEAPLPPEATSPAPSQAPAPMPSPAGPVRMMIPAGTWITVRVDEPLSSDHNQAGDAFSGSLAQPVVVNGLVVAHAGQTVTGTISEAKKAGRASGLSRLGLEVTEIALADGNQVQVQTKVMERHGNTSYGRDAVGIGATVGTGAAIGAAVNGGVGAGIGAAAGVVASTIGVLLTRGEPTVVYPETALTFQLQTPVTIEGSSQSFRPASQQDYQPAQQLHRSPPPRPAYRGYGPGPYAYPPYPYPYPYPYVYGPSLFFGFGGYHHGYHRHW